MIIADAPLPIPVQNSLVTGNLVTGLGAQSLGVGGAIYIAERCTSGVCTSANATFNGVSMSNNTATQVGQAPESIKGCWQFRQLSWPKTVHQY